MSQGINDNNLVVNPCQDITDNLNVQVGGIKAVQTPRNTYLTDIDKRVLGYPLLHKNLLTVAMVRLLHQGLYGTNGQQMTGEDR